MADITNPEAVRFCDEKIRTLADLAARYYYAAEAMANEWDAIDMGSKIPNTADLLADEAVMGPDGRSPITGAMVHGLHGHAKAMLADLDANNQQKLHVLLQIEVNGSP